MITTVDAQSRVTYRLAATQLRKGTHPTTIVDWLVLRNRDCLELRLEVVWYDASRPGKADREPRIFIANDARFEPKQLIIRFTGVFEPMPMTRGRDEPGALVVDLASLGVDEKFSSDETMAVEFWPYGS